VKGGLAHNWPKQRGASEGPWPQMCNESRRSLQGRAVDRMAKPVDAQRKRGECSLILQQLICPRTHCLPCSAAMYSIAQQESYKVSKAAGIACYLPSILLST
jgi:hypothetical protein